MCSWTNSLGSFNTQSLYAFALLRFKYCYLHNSTCVLSVYTGILLELTET